MAADGNQLRGEITENIANPRMDMDELLTGFFKSLLEEESKNSGIAIAELRVFSGSSLVSDIPETKEAQVAR